MKAWKLFLGFVLVCVAPFGGAITALAAPLPALSKPTLLYFSLTGFKWNRPIFQTGGNTDISYFVDGSDFHERRWTERWPGGDCSCECLQFMGRGPSSADIALTQRPDDGAITMSGTTAGLGRERRTLELRSSTQTSSSADGFPQSFFDDLGGGTSILGVTWIFGFVPGPGDPVGPNGLLDADGDGYDDFAMAEIYFNDYFAWNVDGSDIDIETVAFHEIGHALGLDHSADTEAAMYAYYQGVRRSPSPDDVAGISTLYPLASPIPEPSTILLLGAGLVGLGFWGRKRMACKS